ncbi:S8 family serine peptidase [Massilia sp. Dwa41.01b]|uniref:S8 family peptidase n=1 Tax=Massilia sp. Dwa41.01b TaxID=2709302 RepID=UPI001E5B6A82|nr:S8 family serine peptidase [Massilia sp. Dwa41.01b]
MTRVLVLLLAFVLMLAFSDGAGAQEANPVPAAEAAPAVAPPPAATQRQLLVMLRLPPDHFHADGAYGGGYNDDSGGAARRRLAQALAASHHLRVRDNWSMPAIGVDCFLMEETDDTPLERVLDALAHDARVVWAQSIEDFRALGSADPLYPIQPAARDWHLADLHRISTGRNVHIAVIDSGVDASHPDLAGQLVLRRNFVDDVPDAAETHGTAVAGVIGAQTGNGVGIAGVAPGARIMALRACWEQARQPARCNSFTLGKAINFALENGARIINLSLGGPPDRLLQSLLDAALARGVIVVGAADPQRADGGFPAAHPGVIAVGRGGERRLPLSTMLYAPGTDIPSCMPGTRWGVVSGSSYAAAHVAGLSALLAQLQPRANAQSLRRMLDAAAASSAGNIDACAALRRAFDACVCQCSQSSATTRAVSP